MKRALTIILAILPLLTVLAQSPADSVKVYFRAGFSQFDPSLDHNASRMDAFVAAIRDAEAKGALDHIEIQAFASPDGTHKANLRLADARCRTIESYLLSHSGLSRDLITTAPGDIAWDELRRMVEANPDVPARQQVLDILDNTPVWIFDSRKRVVGGRKQRLMDLRGGRPYNWMLRNLFPELRNGVAVLLYIKESTSPESTSADESDGAVLKSADDLLLVCPADSLDDLHPLLPADSLSSELTEKSDLLTVVESLAAPSREPYRKLFALRNNILYDAILMPNLDFEWLINEDWSVAGGADVAWWRDTPKNKIYQIAMFRAEARRWLLQRAPWHGLYVGLMAGVGYYDLENGGTGYRGEGAMLGPTVGYMWPLSKYFSFEGGIGAGYMRTRIKEYEPRDGHHVYLRTKKLNYFGPLNLKFAIVWRFGNIPTPTQHNPAL